MGIREEFEAEWKRQTRILKGNIDAILHERIEAWCAERGLTAEIDVRIDWDCHVRVHKLRPAERGSGA